MTVPMNPPAPLALVIGLPVVLALVALLLGWIRRSALAAGVPLGALVLWLGGLGGFVILVGFFLLGTMLTRLGYAAKEAKGVAEDQGGRRGSAHVVANCTTGLIVLILHGSGLVADSALAVLWAAYAGSFAAAASDTASSEIGQLYGRRTVSLRTLRAVPVGTEGAVSIEGLFGGLGAALVLGVLGWMVGFLDLPGVLAVTLGGFLGNVGESLAGSWGRRILPHGGLNFANTVVGALLAAGLRALF
jgi:uncharacterized protein (TIGR00297 family)